MIQVHGLTADDVVLMPAPLAHISGLQNAVTVAGVGGMKAVLMARWDPEHALAADRAPPGHVHDGPADVLRRAAGHARVQRRAGAVDPAHLLRRRRRDAELRGARRPRCSSRW